MYEGSVIPGKPQEHSYFFSCLQYRPVFELLYVLWDLTNSSLSCAPGTPPLTGTTWFYRAVSWFLLIAWILASMSLIACIANPSEPSSSRTFWSLLSLSSFLFCSIFASMSLSTGSISSLLLLNSSSDGYIISLPRCSLALDLALIYLFWRWKKNCISSSSFFPSFHLAWTCHLHPQMKW